MTIDSAFTIVVENLRKGIPIYKTLKRIHYHSNIFYKLISKEQLTILGMERIATKKLSCKITPFVKKELLSDTANYFYEEE